ncbi:nicotinic acid mononucleotide adenylyltransferase [Actinomadura craniellae]|uniref:Probable nicotinate-nucleotide adenylyltransferase n=2 Tax=Actinomadura craniellae TaxID=2231787 RepID=A0A365HAB9_9ACTN|nr:nicotinic acid mononucleotide adenylyltransferase [Actinomadura craniellae]
MGGTFDPIHNAHLLKADVVARSLGLDAVVFIPAGQPWHKNMAEVSSAADRYAMTVIATATDPRFSVSRVEIDRGGPTYTVDTFQELRRVLGEQVELFLIAGADVLKGILTWREARLLPELTNFVFCSRPGHRLLAVGLPPERVTLLHVPERGISSTSIRRRVGCGEPIRHLVPAAVADYIECRGLYRPDRLPVT